MEIAFEKSDQEMLLAQPCSCVHVPGLRVSFPLNQFWVQFIPEIGNLKSSILKIGNSAQTVNLCLCSGFTLKVENGNLVAEGRPSPINGNSNQYNLLVDKSTFQMTAQAGGIGIGDIRDNANKHHKGILFDLNKGTTLSVQYQAGPLGATMMNLEFHPWYVPTLF